VQGPLRRATRAGATILWAIGAIALWLAGLTLIVLGVVSGLSGEPQGWWVLGGLIVFVAGFFPTYHLLRRLEGSG
jgi:hypothetical protein